MRGGSDRVFFETNRLLQKHGHTVIPFAAQDARNEPNGWRAYFPVAANFEHPRPIDLARYVYSFPAAKKIREIIRDQRPDIAHLHIYYGKLTASILEPLKQAGIPIVQTLHDYKIICPVNSLVSKGKLCEACQGRYFWNALPRRCNRNSFARTALSVLESYVSRAFGAQNKVDHFIAVSEFMRKKIIAHGIPSTKITTIYNFIDSENTLINKAAGKYFIYFGRIERIKGIFTLVEAFASLTHLKLKIVGDGSDLKELRRTIESRGLSHIEITGFQYGEQLESVIDNSIAAIVPSQWYEPFGLTVIEAFLHTRAVIASEIGALPELINQGGDGFLTPPGNVNALREKILWFARHPLEALQMGRAGRQKALARFDPAHYLDELMHVYRIAMGQK
jgi:glycosyltransferase involved in cell wall biosynthesis